MVIEKKHLPANCPLEGAEPANHTMYRLVKNDPPTENDFMRWMDEHPEIAKKKKKNKKEWCKCHAVSFNSSLENLIAVFRNNHNNAAKKYCGIVKGDLSNVHGEILQTGRPTHFSLWKSPEAQVHKGFKVIHKGGHNVT